MLIDKKIVKAIKKNDRRVILQLYNYSFNKIMGVTVRYFANEEDKITIVNNSFMKIIDNIKDFKIGSQYFAWISRITYNEVINFYRKEKKYKTLFDFEMYDFKIDTHTEYKEEEIDWIDEGQLLELIQQLPKSTKIVFDMYAIEGGYTYKDIAQFLNISVETVKWHLKLARKQLKEALNKIKKYEFER